MNRTNASSRQVYEEPVCGIRMLQKDCFLEDSGEYTARDPYSSEGNYGEQF